MNALIAAFYRFTPLPDPAGLRTSLHRLCIDNDIRGTVLVADEGVNGTIAGARENVHWILAHLRTLPGLADLEHTESHAGRQPFHRMKLRLKKELVTLGVEHVDANACVGTYVPPRAWNALISDPQVLVIDTRNDYECEIGTFANALNPRTHSFREFPAFVQRQLDPGRHRRVALFCTGGIRCEKATAYLRRQGFGEVYHLHGGILRYLEEVSESESLWHGECLVFDERVSVDHALQPGRYELCRACRQPVAARDKASPAYVEGISCHRCSGTLSDDKLRAVTERQKQVRLARARGGTHIGTMLAPGAR